MKGFNMLILPCDGFVHYETIGTHETVQIVMHF